MKTKIKSVTIVNQAGSRSYEVGDEINGLKIDKIQDCGVDGDDVFCPIYSGFTSDNTLVFEAVNCPMDIQYEADTAKAKK